METLRREILECFGVLEEALIAECAKICQMFNLSGEDLFYKWEAMNFGVSGRQPFASDVIPALKAKCQSDLAKATVRQKVRVNLTGPLSRNLGSGIGRPGIRLDAQLGNKIPVKPSVRRQDGFDMTASEQKASIAGSSKVRFIGPKSDKVPHERHQYRYMYETVYDRSTALDRRIDDMGQLVKEHYGIEDLSDPSAATEEIVTVVGRIVHDLETSGGAKLNEASLVLESSRQMGSGVRVSLRFDPALQIRQARQGVGSIGFFPGAIVACKGKNGGGGWFLVTEILTLPPLPPNPGIATGDSADSFSICVACGPFTPDSDLNFNSWKKLLDKVKVEKPTVLLLVGPFIDVNHPVVKNGEMDISAADMFHDKFQLLDFLKSSPDSMVLIVPSVRDAISDHAVLPQCELGSGFAPDPRVLMLPNPCRFSLNGLSFAITSVDVLFHLRKEEFVKRAQEVDPIPSVSKEEHANDLMTNTCRHILQQRSFYPLFPAPYDLSHEVNLDVSHSGGLNICTGGAEASFAPDVLITPSRLKHFVKTVDSSLAINPSSVAKGTYAMITYTNPGEGVSINDCVRANIVKLGLTA